MPSATRSIMLLLAILLSLSLPLAAAVKDSSGQRTLGSFSDRAMAQQYKIDWSRCSDQNSQLQTSAIVDTPERFTKPRIALAYHNSDGHSVRVQSWGSLKRGSSSQLGRGSGRVIGLSLVPILVADDGSRYPLVPSPPESAQGFNRYYPACGRGQSTAPFPDLYPSILLTVEHRSQRDPLVERLKSARDSDLLPEPRSIEARFEFKNGEAQLRSGRTRIDTLSELAEQLLRQGDGHYFLRGWEHAVNITHLGYSRGLGYRYEPGAYKDLAPAPADESRRLGDAPTQPVDQDPADSTQSATAPAVSEPNEQAPERSPAVASSAANGRSPQQITLTWPRAWPAPIRVEGCREIRRSAGELVCGYDGGNGGMVVSWGNGWEQSRIAVNELGFDDIDLGSRLAPRWPFSSDDPWLDCSHGAPCYAPYRLRYCNSAARFGRDCCGGYSMRYNGTGTPQLPSLALHACDREQPPPTHVKLYVGTLRLQHSNRFKTSERLVWKPSEIGEKRIKMESIAVR